ncbi:transcriptional regulator [Phycicoccus sp. Root563]|uniref:helix-turn-helix transcriptional regulator n=1 Tax=Phycicoccus sp. Root563 TaxID=1736562 RepID=UPI000702B3EB|nr:WYL domain-containing protein [Phycicoccus sp. Root563]KQZ88157.1 transcriptional regulator [Phycicoccus sp. Root563]
MSSPSGPAAKTERLLNLVLCLLYTRRPLPKSKIRDIVPQYGDAASDEAFDRMFERDKDELRELGIPLVTAEIGGVWDDEVGYRIDQREYALPDIEFEPDELAVLGLASRTWAHASLAGPAAQALRKLKAAGIERDGDSLIGIEPRLGTSEPAFEPVKNAVVGQQTISFGYRTGGQGEVNTRRVQPWGLASWHGRWYLTGFDLDRGAPRVFRLSRIDGAVSVVRKAEPYTVPADHRAQEMIASTVGEQEPRTSVVRVREGRGQSLRRRGAAVGTEGEWTVLEVPFSDPYAFADEVSGYGADVVVSEPPEVRDLVVERLRGAVRAHAAVASAPTTGGAA